MSPMVLWLIAALSTLALPAWLIYGFLRRRRRLRGVKRLLVLLPALGFTAAALCMLGVICAGLFVSSAMTW